MSTKHNTVWENCKEIDNGCLNLDENVKKYKRLQMVILDYQNDNYILQFRLRKVHEEILIEEFIENIELYTVFNSVKSDLFIQFKSEITKKELRLEISCFDYSKYKALKDDISVRVKVNQLMAFKHSAGPISIEFYCGSNSMDTIEIKSLRLLHITPYFIANNSVYLNMNEFLSFECESEDNMYILMKRYGEKNYIYMTKIMIENTVPFQKNHLTLSVEDWRPRNQLRKQLSKLSLSTLDTQANDKNISIELFYEYNSVNKFTLEKFLHYPADEFYESICKKVKNLGEYPDSFPICDMKALPLRFLHWMRNTKMEIDFVGLKKLFSSAVVSFLFPNLPVHK